MFSSLHRQWLSWSHACGRSGALRGFDLARPAVSAGPNSFQKLTTYQNMCLQLSREFTSHLSLHCCFADGGCYWGRVALGEDLLQDKNAERVKKKKNKNGEVRFSVHYLWMGLLTDKMIHFIACWAKAEGGDLPWLCPTYPPYCIMHLSDSFSVDLPLYVLKHGCFSQWIWDLRFALAFPLMLHSEGGFHAQQQGLSFGLFQPPQNHSASCTSCKRSSFLNAWNGWLQISLFPPNNCRAQVFQS